MIVLAWICIGIVAGMLFLALFRPSLKYAILDTQELDPESDEFLPQLEILGGSRVYRHCMIDVLTDGCSFYEAELEAISKAEHNVHIEAYIFWPGEISERFVKTMIDRARAGVEVKMILDGVGSFGTFDGYFKELAEAGGEVVFYHPIRWHTWDRYNNRTHRELIIVDGKVGFIGGAGFADHWYKAEGKRARWRDSMYRVRGEAIAGLQSVFIENWTEAAGEIPSFGRDICLPEPEGNISAQVVGSTPSAGGSARNRMVFQTFFASAKKSLHISTPYFLPDASIRDALIRAKVDRAVDVKIITTGQKSDQLMTRRASRRLYGALLEAGTEIYEYQPGMNHVKAMIVDGLWSVVGSTNFDHRSFGLNDEVNLVARDRDLAGRIEQDFQSDLLKSKRITHEEWSRRPPWEWVHEFFSGLLERQQ